MPKKNDLVFVPLGGTGEIGMNCNLYGYGKEQQRDWIMVDLGVTFGKADTPGVDLIMPDIAFIELHIESLHGLLLTHGHEDHIGAVAHLWPLLKCPIYATPFTAELVRGKLAQAGLGDDALHIIAPDAHFTVGPFTIDYIGLTHSIAEPSALAIRCGDAKFLHTGDWKIDPDPVIGRPTESDKLKAFGDAGVDAIICDSTNVLEAGRSGSEAEVGAALTEIIADSPRRVVVTTFASNVARLTSIAQAAIATDRHFCLLGRGMHKIYRAARNTGYFAQFPDLVDEADAASLPPEKLLICCTGSQGENRAALARLARGSHPHITLEAGDRVIFSSKRIPGNETEINELQNQLACLDVEVILPHGNDLHVSGHPCRDELVDMYSWVKPRAAIPVHGEHRHLIAHAELARELGVKEPLHIRNGDMVRLAPAPTEIIDNVQNGRLYLDGDVLVSAQDEAVQTRRRLASDGVVFVVVPLDEYDNVVGEADVQMLGIANGESDILENELRDGVARALGAFGKTVPPQIETDIAKTVRRILMRHWGKKPLVIVSFGQYDRDV